MLLKELHSPIAKVKNKLEEELGGTPCELNTYQPNTEQRKFSLTRDTVGTEVFVLRFPQPSKLVFDADIDTPTSIPELAKKRREFLAKKSRDFVDI